MTSATTSKIYAIHHVNYPTTDKERALDWYSKVFGMVQDDVSKYSKTPILLMHGGQWDIHLTPVKEMPKMPFHLAIEVTDWDWFMDHLKEVGVEASHIVERPQNNSKSCRIYDPDGTRIEITYHGDWHTN